jgi:hypothetical protein
MKLSKSLPNGLKGPDSGLYRADSTSPAHRSRKLSSLDVHRKNPPKLSLRINRLFSGTCCHSSDHYDRTGSFP